ncbi:hypothetical protein NSK_001614 [Nannochloropsis salina CCMP1776]|uniref:Uncharacterized protein n=1 Tax=Nannochloropsis salina CCMP1776 TaxID=1027361 RepID=A0A4D9D6U0_9STRA|nr:hypothetical protein NSK_001614 [Nannochloropsis salina CCMP1776]|eukprot:TFJ87282.1 hypothetical protein NSK_001614 [Nannochloropsis salina CCMP1776]
MASALLYEASIALDDYATASNPRRYISKGIAPARGPASLNLSTYRDHAWSKGEHPKFTDFRTHWNNAVWRARSSIVAFVDDIGK